MEYEEDGNRIKTLSKILRAIVDIYGLARDEGVVAVRFFNNSRPAKNLTRANVETVIKNIEYNGVTMIGTQLQDKILKRFVLKKKDMVRPVLAIIITDGHVGYYNNRGLTLVVLTTFPDRGREGWASEEKHQQLPCQISP